MKRVFQDSSVMSFLLLTMCLFPFKAAAAARHGAHISYGGHFSWGGHRGFSGHRGYHSGVGLHLGFAFGLPIFNSAYYRNYWEPYSYEYTPSYSAPTVVVGGSARAVQIPSSASDTVATQSPLQVIADPPRSKPFIAASGNQSTVMSSANRLFGR